MNAHLFSVNVSSLSNVTVTDEEGAETEGGVQTVPVLLTSGIILLSLLALLTASMVTRRRERRLRQRQSEVREAIVTSGENRAVSREIEASLGQWRGEGVGVY